MTRRPVQSPPSAAERQRKSRAARVAEGGAIVQAVLTPEEAAALRTLRARDGHATDRDAIGAALLAAVSS